MADRHLRLVPTPDLAPAPELAHAHTIQSAAHSLRRRGLRLEVTITDEDGVEIVVDPASATARGFAVRAEAFHRIRNPFGGNAAVRIGVSDPVPRDEFLNRDGEARRSAEAEAVLDLMQQLRPHPVLVR